MSSADWWAQKLAQQNPQQPQVGRPTNMPPMPPSQQPMAPMPSFQPQTTERAQSAKQTLRVLSAGRLTTWLWRMRHRDVTIVVTPFRSRGADTEL